MCKPERWGNRVAIRMTPTPCDAQCTGNRLYPIGATAGRSRRISFTQSSEEPINWTDAQHQEYLARPTTTLLVLYYRGTPAGYIELDASTGDETEIGYFGLMGFVHGRGFGKHLLSV